MLTIENNTFSEQQIIKLRGELSGINALQFRDKASTIVKIKQGELHLDISQISKMDLTGFNSVIMLKKETGRKNISFLLIADTDNPIHEFIHLSKLPFHCVSSSSN